MNDGKSSVCAVVGGQYGSEGKGLIVGKIARDYDWHIRVGAANAGHTLYTEGENSRRPAVSIEGSLPPFGEIWNKHVMQQIPCAAYAHPDARLLIGPGALISPEIFQRELEELVAWRKTHGMEPPTIWIDPRAQVITQQQIVKEANSDLQERIGSTSATAREGIGQAQADRVMRDAHCVTAADYFDSMFALWDLTRFCNVPAAIHGVVRGVVKGEGRASFPGFRSVLLEGTQGAGLSLTTGQFPFVTSRNTTSAGLAADCGVAPNVIGRIVMVCRSYPIRVAGPSGPFYGDSQEIDWKSIGIDPEKERTTVTKKIRRVATLSVRQIADSAAINGATEIALTFADYIDKGIAGSDSRISGKWKSLSAFPAVEEVVDDIEQHTGVPVTMIGTGPHSIIELDR